MDILNNLNVDGKVKAVTGTNNDELTTKKYVDDADALKVDKLVTKPTASTYTQVTINAEGQVTGGANPTTLSGYGITDAVDKGSAQEITGVKTFATTGDNVIIGLKNTDKYNVTPSSNKFNILQFKDSDDVEQARIDFYHITSGSKYFRQRIKAENGTEKNFSLVVDANGNGYAQAPYRTYGSANVNDIVTIGSLASNPNVVHTSNNENIFGIKLFENDVKKRTNLPNLTTTTGTYLGKIIFTAVDNSIAGELRFLQSNGERAIYVGVNDTSGNTTWVKLVGVTL